MAISGDLVRRFFSGDCTEEEKKEVMDHFHDHPEKLAAYLTEESWEKFLPGQAPGHGQEVPTDRIRRLLAKKVGRPPVRKIVYARLAAASLILVTGLVFLIRSGGGHRSGQPLTPDLATAAPPATAPAARTAELETISNTSAKNKSYTLADGSTVELAGNSAISFHRPFINDRREIYLKGAAVFTVAKVKTMPFTVYSGKVATTALGTVFSVDGKLSLITEVHLFSGRIVIKKEVSADKAAFKDIYLEPGQDLILDNTRDITVLSYTNPRMMGGTTKKTVKPVQPQIFTFNRQSLAEILDLLQHACHASLIYDTAAVKNMDFTGSFNKDKESLDSFLATLCSLNDLEFTKTGPNSFSIGKK
jgi:ferric-dicitrate binding protein FerR (iron transport regulator)